MSGSSLDPHFDMIQDLKRNGSSYEEMSVTLQAMGIEKGTSVSNLKKFCSSHGLTNPKWGKTSDDQLEFAVEGAVRQVGPMCGRKMMTGFLSSKGVHASESRVGDALKKVRPDYHEARQQGARNLNPNPYRADYFGQKLHIDQHEKMVMFGVTHVVAIDGYSGKIVGHSTLPIKNNLTIYEEVYRKSVLTYGLWDQLRSDYGTEFRLSQFMQEKLTNYRHCKDRPACIMTTSTQVNNRINYPIKACLMDMTNQETINMDDRTVQFCVSALACQVASIGISRFVESWNAHRVPGRGIPNMLALGGCHVKINEHLLPVASKAADLYDMDNGSSLTRMSIFGSDPFESDEERNLIRTRFVETFGDIESIFDNIVNHNPTPFENALQHLIHLCS